jgi:hypothetical protein
MNNVGSANLENAAPAENAPAENALANSNTPANSPSLGEQLGEEPATLQNTNSVNQGANSANQEANTSSPPPVQPEAMPEPQNVPMPPPLPEALNAAAPPPKAKKPMTEGQAKLQADRAETLRLMREEYRKVFGDDKKAPKAKVSNAARLTTVRVKQGHNVFMTTLYDDYISRNQGKGMNKPRNKTMKKSKVVPELRAAPIAPLPVEPIAAPTKSPVFSPSKEGKVEIHRQLEHLLRVVHKQAVEEATRRVRRLLKGAGASSTTIHHLSRMILRGKESHAAAFLKSACAAHSPLTSPKTAKKRVLFANKKR